MLLEVGLAGVLKTRPGDLPPALPVLDVEDSVLVGGVEESAPRLGG